MGNPEDRASDYEEQQKIKREKKKQSDRDSYKRKKERRQEMGRALEILRVENERLNGLNGILNNNKTLAEERLQQENHEVNQLRDTLDRLRRESDNLRIRVNALIEEVAPLAMELLSPDLAPPPVPLAMELPPPPEDLFSDLDALLIEQVPAPTVPPAPSYQPPSPEEIIKAKEEILTLLGETALVFFHEQNQQRLLTAVSIFQQADFLTEEQRAFLVKLPNTIESLEPLLNEAVFHKENAEKQLADREALGQHLQEKRALHTKLRETNEQLQNLNREAESTIVGLQQTIKNLQDEIAARNQTMEGNSNRIQAETGEINAGMQSLSSTLPQRQAWLNTQDSADMKIKNIEYEWALLKTCLA